jgi:lipoprotein-releasing system ATP-binding protein
MSSVIACQRLSKSFLDVRRKLQVLHELDFAIGNNETAAIVGVSGSGKSTLLHLLGGLDKPTQGVVLWKDENIARWSEAKKCKERNHHLGFIYQFHYLLPEFTALENVAMPLLIAGKSVLESRERAKTCLAQVGLSARETHKLGELSGGERQRVAIARAIVSHPQCVLADEPTGNLDHKTAQDVFRVMMSVHETVGTSFVIVTHDMQLAEQLQKCYTLDQ